MAENDNVGQEVWRYITRLRTLRCEAKGRSNLYK